MIPAKQILLGLALVVGGALIVNVPGWTVYGIPVSSGQGMLLIFAGVIWIGYVLLNRKKILIQEETVKEAKREAKRFVICPRCGETKYAKDVPGLKCPKCETALEELEGFYDRHPNLKLEEND